MYILIDNYTKSFDGIQKDVYITTPAHGVFNLYHIIQYPSGHFFKSEIREFTGPDAFIIARIIGKHEVTYL